MGEFEKTVRRVTTNFWLFSSLVPCQATRLCTAGHAPHAATRDATRFSAIR